MPLSKKKKKKKIKEIQPLTYFQTLKTRPFGSPFQFSPNDPIYFPFPPFISIFFSEPPHPKKKNQKSKKKIKKK
jgi:hypothetical protein